MACASFSYMYMRLCVFSVGNHQLEVAQLNIKLREVTAELEEAHLTYSHHLVPSSSSTEGVRGSSGEDDDEHIYEEPPEEVRYELSASVHV